LATRIHIAGLSVVGWREALDVVPITAIPVVALARAIVMSLRLDFDAACPSAAS
jgi:hypothetical protein